MICVHLELASVDDGLVRELRDQLDCCPGDDSVFVWVHSPERSTMLRLGEFDHAGALIAFAAVFPEALVEP